MIENELDEALGRLARTGPEFEGWLSNHGPMAVECLVRHGQADAVHHWLDGYLPRLDEPPRGIDPIVGDQWRPALGDPRRSGDWIAYFARAMAEDPWRAVLITWWPRLLPGIAASATHGVIRTGHAVRSLLENPTAARTSELGLALAYWAARWQSLELPGRARFRPGDPRAALDRVPAVADQREGIRHRLAQLAATDGWARAALEMPVSPDDAAQAQLGDIATAAVRHYLFAGQAAPVMLVHAATAPNAVLMALPVLPAALHTPSVAAAWAATAAVTSAYAPAGRRPLAPSDEMPDETRSAPHACSRAEVIQAATKSGDPHAIKFADTALSAHSRTPDPHLLAAAMRAVRLIPSES